MYLACRVDIMEIQNELSKTLLGSIGKKMRSIANINAKLTVAGLVMCLTMGTALANTLSEVEINPQGSGYGIVLKADTVTPIKKIVSSNDRMSIILKDVTASQELNTVYNNVENLENVTVQPLSKKDVKITFKGKNIANSKVSFSTGNAMAPIVPVAPVQSIELNAPVSHYQPVYTPEMFEDETISEPSQTSNPELNALLTKMHISREMLITAKKYTKAAVKKANSMLHGDVNSMTLLGILMIAGALLVNFRRKPSAKPVIARDSIGLPSKANIEREIEINKTLSDTVKDNMSARSIAQMGYGMKAYQQSQRNPYTSNPVSTNGVSGIARRKPLSTAPIKKQALAAKPITKDSAPLKSTMPKTQLPKPQVNTARLNAESPIKPMPKAVKQTSIEPDTDSLKFLESITKIYENSGRADLAKGLKDNLKKAQLAQI